MGTLHHQNEALLHSGSHTKVEAQVDTILFFGGTEATDRWKTLKEQMSAEDCMSSDKVFEAFANSFEKSSSYWQAREEYLSDIKQSKQQMTAELDIYIKDLVRRCQFNRTEVEAHKIDLLYHATVHFEVRKFVHNAKPEEVTYDKMIEVAKAHEQTCHEYQLLVSSIHLQRVADRCWESPGLFLTSQGGAWQH